VKVFRDADADLALIQTRRVAIIGYGNQGRAHALNLRDSGVTDIVIGMRPGSDRTGQIREDGFEVVAIGEAVRTADIVMLLAPDESHAAIWTEHLRTSIKPGAALGFAHGLAVHFGLIEPRADIDVFLVAPKGPGRTLRSEYVAGPGMPALFAVARDATGAAQAIALSYAAALGCGRAAILASSFQEETEADLFNEQAVVWGAVPDLLEAGFETLVEGGFSPEIAYFECITELKLLADLIHDRGIAAMREAISNTAEFGAVTGHGRIVTEETRAEMRKILAEVRDGSFVRALTDEAVAGYPRLRSARDAATARGHEKVGRDIRSLAAGETPE